MSRRHFISPNLPQSLQVFPTTHFMRPLRYTNNMFFDFTAPIVGQLLLSQPVTTKLSKIEQDDNFTVGISSMQGWRTTMEDTFCIHLKLPTDTTNTAMIGVFDGHGGGAVADFVSNNFHKFLVRQQDFKQDIKKAIVKSFIDIDERLRKDGLGEQSGTTAIVVYIRDNILYCGNCGDSRAIAYENGHMTALSYDHKPTLPGEYRRIVYSGGRVENDRVNGILALSRALGDFQFKSSQNRGPELQMVSCIPEIMTKKLDKHWSFVLLASDGIWEVMSNEKVCDFVKHRIADGLALDKVCEALINSCLAKRLDGSVCLGCDNMTVIIIQFKLPQKN